MEQNETGEYTGRTIEEQFGMLEEILKRMDAEDTGLEESFRLYEEGIRLIRQTGASIDRVEKQIQILSEEG